MNGASSSPQVAIIVLNWNGCSDTLACLESLRRLDYSNCWTLVVDNGSEDGSVSTVQEQFPEVEVLALGHNLGFTGGHNLGMKYALQRGADYVFLLNNDTQVARDALGRAVRVAEANSDLGIVGCHLRRMDGTTDVVVGFDWVLGRTRVAHTLHNEPPGWVPVEAVSGGAMLVRRAVLERVGLLDDRYYLYFEDQDWCVRARRAGFGCALVSDAIVWHHVGASSRGSDQNPRASIYYYLTRNNILLMRRYASRSALLIFAPYSLSQVIWRAIRVLGGGVLVGKGNVRARLSALAAGFVDGWRGRAGARALNEHRGAPA